MKNISNIILLVSILDVNAFQTEDKTVAHHLESPFSLKYLDQNKFSLHKRERNLNTVDCSEASLFKFELEIGLDYNPSKISWKVTNNNNVTEAVVETGGPYTNLSYLDVVQDSFCLEKDVTYKFILENLLGDGFFLMGYLKLFVDNQIIQETYGPTSSFYNQEITLCSNDSDCMDENICTVGTCDAASKQCTQSPRPDYSAECTSYGAPTTLAIKVNAPDTSSSITLDDLREILFANKNVTADEGSSMLSQFSSCSFDKFNLQPFEGTTSTGVSIQNGLTELQLSESILSKQAGEIVTATLVAAETELGNLESQFDYVLLCLPPGTLIGESPNWKAYAYVNSYLSIYNDDACESLSILMHELGHNLGLSHSNDKENYGDESGYLGISYGTLGGKPRKCFNGAKSWQLGWYHDSHILFDVSKLTTTQHQEYTLVGVADYNNRDNKATIVKLINIGDGYDYYIALNTPSNMNIETNEGASQMLVTRRDTGDSYADSYLVAMLDNEQTYDIERGYNGTKIGIRSAIYLDPDPIYANVFINLATEKLCSNDSECAEADACTIGKCDRMNIFNNLICSFSRLTCNECGTMFSINVKTGESPQDIKWDIKDMSSKQLVKSSGYFTELNTFYNQSECLPYGEYVFSILYSENSTTSTSPASSNWFLLAAGESEVIDSGHIKEASYIESIFTVCSTDADCHDYEGCTIDTCDLNSHICKNIRYENLDECKACRWVSLNITTDNFSEETTWGLYNFESDEVVLSGDPFPVGFLLGFGRSKAPTKAGRRKAPTRTSAQLLTRKLVESENSISERMCLETEYLYYFIIKDSFGDGMCCSEGEGFYLLQVDNDTILQRGGNFTDYEDISFKFMSCTSEESCDDSNPCTKDVCLASSSVCIYKILACHECGAMVSVSIITDIAPDQTSWTITSTQKEYLSGGSYTASFHLYESSVCLPYGSYSFNAYDSGFNGMGKCHLPDVACGYSVSVNDDIIGQNGDFFEQDTLAFQICSADNECDDLDACTSNQCNVTCVYEMDCALCGQSLFTVDIGTDNNPWETEWKVFDNSSSSQVMTYGPYEWTQSYKILTHSQCFPAGVYKWKITDTSGDGLTSCLLDGFNCGYNLTLDNNIIKSSGGEFASEESLYFEIQAVPTTSPTLSAWYIELDEEYPKSKASLKKFIIPYRFTKGKDLQSHILDSTCMIRNTEQTVIAVNKTIEQDFESKYDLGIITLSVNDTIMEKSSFWTNNTSSEQGMLSFCVVTELMHNNLSVSFVETKINMIIDFDSKVESTSLGGAKKKEAKEVVDKSSFSLSACVCDELADYECSNDLEITQNSKLSLCIASPAVEMEITSFGSLVMYQDGIVKYTAISNGVASNILTTTTFLENKAIVETRLVSLFFERDTPSKVMVKGEVLLDFKTTRRSLEEAMVQDSQKATFTLDIPLSRETKQDDWSFGLKMICIGMTLLISLEAYKRKKEIQTISFERVSTLEP